MTTLFEYPDGSMLIQLNSSHLRNYQPWVGQRPLSEDHISAIEENIEGDVTRLDRDYKLVKIINEETERPQCYIIDGQHRAAILSRHSDVDFELTATVYDYTDKTVEDVNELFRRINFVKPFTIDDDAITLDINKIAGAIMMYFNEGRSTKDLPIRQARTKAPYMCINVITNWLRELAAEYGEVPNDKLAMRVLISANEDCLSSIRDSTKVQHARCKELGFALAMTDSKTWTEDYRISMTGS